MQINVELSQFPITYYFHENEASSAMAPALFYLAEVARDTASRNPGAALGTTALGGSIDDLANLVCQRYLRRKYETRWELLLAMNADHCRHALKRPR